MLFHLFLHSLVDSCMCPDQRLNPQPSCVRDDALSSCTSWPRSEGVQSFEVYQWLIGKMEVRETSNGPTNVVCLLVKNTANPEHCIERLYKRLSLGVAGDPYRQDSISHTLWNWVASHFLCFTVQVNSIYFCGLCTWVAANCPLMELFLKS